ncbi:MAG: hypothetical protein CMQ15_14555 [Gammaproteobacteria bacterium]|nr:hypothetical protein [Gammaproteobacteria bacterium]|tara:strand:+ start:64 stop:2052 length:1989 start_codon:yes stop_codon:yes gene_type:complete
MPKTIAFVDNFDDVEIFLKTFKFCIDRDTTCIAGDALALAALRNNGIKCRALDDYRNQKEYEEAELSAVELAGKWFIDSEGNDLTEFEGISLGKCLKRETFDYFNYLLKAILDVSNILKYENPEKVLLVSDYTVSNNLFLEGHFSQHNKVFQFMGKDKKYDVYIDKAKIHALFLKLKNISRHLRFERQDILAGKITYYCPVIMNRFIKKLTVTTVDRIKLLLTKNVNKLGSIRVLTLSATDLMHFGSALVKSYLRKGNQLYYFDSENNCYFDSRLICVPKKNISLPKNNKKLEYLSDLKFKFERSKKMERNDPRWVFKDLPLINFIDEYLNYIIERKIPELINLLLHSDYVINKNNINIVLISERWGANRVALTQIAKQNGIPVLHIPHSVEAGFKDGDKIHSPHLFFDLAHFPFYPTHEVSSLKYHQQMQVMRGISKEKLFLTGLSRFGNQERKSRKMYYDARKRLGFSEDEEIVLIFLGAEFRIIYDKIKSRHHNSTFKTKCLYEEFLKLFLNRKKSKIVLKLKMSDISDLLVDDFIKRNNMDNVVIFRNNLNDLLIASDAVVVIHSNIGIEAMFYETPVIVYSEPSNPSFLPISAEGVAINISKPDELLPILNKLCSDKTFRQERIRIQRNFLNRNLPTDNLTFYNRVADVIFQLAKKN